MPGSALCTSDSYLGFNQVLIRLARRTLSSWKAIPRAHSPGLAVTEPLRGPGHLPKLLTATFGRGIQSLVLQLAESPARRAEPVWGGQLQGLGPRGLQEPWLKARTLCKAATAHKWGPGIRTTGFGPSLATDVLWDLGQIPTPPWASVSWRVNE